jgi:hypothetical protein
MKVYGEQIKLYISGLMLNNKNNIAAMIKHKY